MSWQVSKSTWMIGCIWNYFLSLNVTNNTKFLINTFKKCHFNKPNFPNHDISINILQYANSKFDPRKLNTKNYLFSNKIKNKMKVWRILLLISRTFYPFRRNSKENFKSYRKKVYNRKVSLRIFLENHFQEENFLKLINESNDLFIIHFHLSPPSFFRSSTTEPNQTILLQQTYND